MRTDSTLTRGPLIVALALTDPELDVAELDVLEASAVPVISTL